MIWMCVPCQTGQVVQDPHAGKPYQDRLLQITGEAIPLAKVPILKLHLALISIKRDIRLLLGEQPFGAELDPIAHLDPQAPAKISRDYAFSNNVEGNLNESCLE